MPALTDQKRPRPADTAAIERPAVRILSVAVLVISVVDRTRWRLHSQNLVNDLEGILHARVPRAAQPEPHQVGEVHADQCRSENQLAGAIAQPDLSGQLAGLVDRGNPDVVARNAQLARQWRVPDIT